MTNLLQDYQDKMAARAKMDLDLQVMYEKIITDKSVSLDTRWDFFIKTPEDFKNHDNYICDFKAIRKYFPNFTWYDDMSLEKYETMNMENMVNQFDDKAISYKTYEYAKKDKIGKMVAENPEFINELKEEILEKNLGSMKYDW